MFPIVVEWKASWTYRAAPAARGKRPESSAKDMAIKDAIKAASKKAAGARKAESAASSPISA